MRFTAVFFLFLFYIKVLLGCGALLVLGTPHAARRAHVSSETARRRRDLCQPLVEGGDGDEKGGSSEEGVAEHSTEHRLESGINRTGGVVSSGDCKEGCTTSTTHDADTGEATLTRGTTTTVECPDKSFCKLGVTGGYIFRVKLIIFLAASQTLFGISANRSVLVFKTEEISPILEAVQLFNGVLVEAFGFILFCVFVTMRDTRWAWLSRATKQRCRACLYNNNFNEVRNMQNMYQQSIIDAGRGGGSGGGGGGGGGGSSEADGEAGGGSGSGLRHRRVSSMASHTSLVQSSSRLPMTERRSELVRHT